MVENTYSKVKKFIEKYHMIETGDVIAAGVSGGADSVCLLHILWRLRTEYDFMLSAVHINHGVRPDAGKDAEYVSRLCQRFGVPFHLKTVDMEGCAKSRGLSMEEAGRALRYEAFEEILAQYCTDGRQGKIAVAHNCNDRAETMLFHLFRGSGIKGLASIQPVRENIIRPILCLERREVEEYLKGYQLDYCEDSTNAEDCYTRNKIRHHILPYAEQEICSGAAGHMGELADILLETEVYMQEQTKLAYERCVLREGEAGTLSDADVRGGESGRTEGLAIDLELMQKEPAVLQKRILLMCLENLTPYRKDITAQHVMGILELIEKGGSKVLSLPYGLQAYKEYNRLYVGRMDFVEGVSKRGTEQAGLTTKTVYDIVPPMEIEIPGMGCIRFDFIEGNCFLHENNQIIPENRYTKWFDYDKITRVLQFRTRQQGDYLTVDETLHKKSLKKYMIDEKIPKAQRERIYMLADGTHILWVPGYRISQYYKVDKNTKRILQVQLRGGSNGGTD